MYSSIINRCRSWRHAKFWLYIIATILVQGCLHFLLSIPFVTGPLLSIFAVTDKCVLGTHTCSSDATCANTLGSFTCACKSGYFGDGHDARRSRRVRTTGRQLQVDRLRSLPRRNLATTGVLKDWDHVKARKKLRELLTSTNNQRVLAKRPPLQSCSLEQGSHPGGSARSLWSCAQTMRSNQRRSSTASNQADRPPTC